MNFRDAQEEFASAANGVPESEEAIWVTAAMGERVLGGVKWERDG